MEEISRNGVTISKSAEIPAINPAERFYEERLRNNTVQRLENHDLSLFLSLALLSSFPLRPNPILCLSISLRKVSLSSNLDNDKQDDENGRNGFA